MQHRSKDLLHRALWVGQARCKLHDAVAQRVGVSRVVGVPKAGEAVHAALGHEQLYRQGLDNQVIPPTHEHKARLIEFVEQVLYIWLQEALDVGHKEVVIETEEILAAVLVQEAAFAACVRLEEPFWLQLHFAHVQIDPFPPLVAIISVAVPAAALHGHISVRVVEAARAHEGEEVERDLTQQEAVVVEPAHPLVPHIVKRRPDPHGVPPDHHSVSIRLCRSPSGAVRQGQPLRVDLPVVLPFLGALGLTVLGLTVAP
mmetsp:Transcript_18163/g.57884  ORF Transcript_18163/g.57884 Transcript_18163/m.57884 type:complete len:258 (+) Transcript_18163:153-926(+)